MRTKVRLKFGKMWGKIQMTPQVFFKHMPYMFKEFEFVSGPKFDFVMYASSYPKGNYTRIYYTPENRPSNVNNYDWGFTYNYDEELKHPRHRRMPNYVRLGAGKNLIKQNVNVERIAKRKKKFCAFIFSHNVPLRNMFFDELSKYKHIDSPGASRRNMKSITECVNMDRKLLKYEEKVKFLSQYKFAICFENATAPGYTTEKIYHAMLANCIPIYWGNPLVGRDFNLRSFIHPYGRKHKSIKHMIEFLISKVVDIDNNYNKYLNMLREPWYPNNKLTPYVDPKRIINRFKRIFGDPK